MKEILKKILLAIKERNFLLFRKNTDGMSVIKKIIFWLYQNFMVLSSGIALGVMLMLYAFGIYTKDYFYSYFDNTYILVLNVLPVVVMVYTIYLLTGRAWLGFILTAIPTWGFSVANMYKIILRNDPVIFEDILNVTTGLTVATSEGYNLAPNNKVLFGAGCVVLGTLVLLFFVRGKLNWKIRLPLVLVPVLFSIYAWPTYTDSDVYNNKTDNIETVVEENSKNRWNTSRIYISKGFIYPFLHSSIDFFVPAPDGYNKAEVEKELSKYKTEDIPDDEKVDIFFIQREAYSDLSLVEGIEGIDFSVYDTYHSILDESYSGRLFTNIFAGGTIDSERTMMTGSYNIKNYRKDTNSYVRYMIDQGYATEGSHPCYNWFYNRENINRYIGFENYHYVENRYGDIVYDKALYTDMIKLYEERDKSKPYFNFSITYQGHGPYGTTWLGYADEGYVTGEFSEYTNYVIKNYLGSLKSSDLALLEMIEYFRASEDPVILCVYGDHKPWLGDSNSVYEELGISLDMSTEEGIINYYTTEYFFWANDAAKEAVGFDFVGEGPMISPCYMMNLLFELCEWEGPAYMQLMDEYLEKLPVTSTVGYYYADGEVTSSPDEKYAEMIADLKKYNYYWMNNYLW